MTTSILVLPILQIFLNFLQKYQRNASSERYEVIFDVCMVQQLQYIVLPVGINTKEYILERSYESLRSISILIQHILPVFTKSIFNDVIFVEVNMNISLLYY